MKDLYKKYYQGIKKFVSRKIDDEGVVEELSNDILLAAINSYPTYNKKSSEFSWLCSIAKHKVIDYYRKKKIKTILFSAYPIFEEIADKALTPERDVLKNELIKEIKNTFKDIKKEYSKILRLKYIEGFRNQQIADILNLSVKAVESRLFRAKKQFKNNWSYDKKKD